MNKGIKRLAAILLGLFGVLAWLIFLVVITDFSKGSPPWWGWLILIGFTALAFLIPFGLVHAIAWIVLNKKQKIVTIVALLLLLAGAVRFAQIKREDLALMAEWNENYAEKYRIANDWQHANSLANGGEELGQNQTFALRRYAIVNDKDGELFRRQEWNHSLLGFFLPAPKNRHSSASSYSPLPVQPEGTHPDTATQEKNDCLIVATETYARLRKTACWARIAGFAYSKGNPGHAVVLFQPTKNSTVWLYDAAAHGTCKPNRMT